MNLIKFLFSRGIHIDRIRVPRCTLRSFMTVKTQDILSMFSIIVYDSIFISLQVKQRFNINNG
jgi:hypothetical protein